MNESKINPVAIDYCPRCGNSMLEYDHAGSYCPDCDFWFAVVEQEARD